MRGLARRIAQAGYAEDDGRYHSHLYKRLAAEDAAFREMLLAIVTDPAEDRALRKEALGLLIWAPTTDAIVAASDALLQWLSASGRDGPDQDFRWHVRQCVWGALLRTDLEDAALLARLQQVFPEVWRKALANAPDPDEVHAGLNENILSHFRKGYRRAKELAAILEQMDREAVARSGTSPAAEEPDILRSPACD
jgi:hypothetical protein